MPVKKSRNWRWGLLIGIGIALSPIHNRWLTDKSTSNGTVEFFLPAFGAALWILGTCLFATWNWSKIKEIGLGNKKIWIPLAVIAVCIGISGAFTGESIQDKVSPFLMGCFLFTIYLVTRVLGKDILFPLAIGAAVASLGVFISAIIHPGEVTGGLLFGGNYDIVVGYVLLGAACFIHKWRWILASLSIVAILLTGSPEGLFAIGALVVCLVVRKDWNNKFVIVLLVIGALAMLLSFKTGLFDYIKSIVNNDVVVAQSSEIDRGGRSPIGYRIWVAQKELGNLQVMGDGYSITDFTHDPIHNVPLIIVQQLGIPGIIAALAWLWVTFYCLVKSRWKYVWVLIIALSLFDHFIFTQLTPIWFVVVGISTVENGSDMVFREHAIPKVISNKEAENRLKRMRDIMNGGMA